MKKVAKTALCALCNAYGVSEDSIKFLGGGREDSDGIAYTYDFEGERRVLKILSLPLDKKEELIALDDRIEFAYFLHENGIKIAAPHMNMRNRLYETYEEGDDIFIAYSMKFYEGGNPKTDDLEDIAFDWGKLIGKSHKATKNFRIWKKLTNRPFEYGHLGEMDFFYNWCKDSFVKSQWLDMKKKLSTLPITRDSYGLIHNDNHQNNILVSNREITLIDFDVACPQFFLQDITVPLQGIMFDKSGGMCGPIYNREPLKKFLHNFIEGYETENHLDDIWMKEHNTFVNYRRLLLFTCMQDYLNTNAELKNGFLSMIKEPVDIL